MEIAERQTDRSFRLVRLILNALELISSLLTVANAHIVFRGEIHTLTNDSVANDGNVHYALPF